MGDLDKEVLTGCYNFEHPGEPVMCVKCGKDFVPSSWCFYNLCDVCFWQWRTAKPILCLTANQQGVFHFCSGMPLEEFIQSPVNK